MDLGENDRMARLISRAEWRWVVLWTMVALLLANVPYLLGWAISTPDLRFGGAVYNVEDMNSYLAKMRQGARGEWLFHTPYTAEEHPGGFFFTFYLLLGRLATLTGLSLEAVFHLARLACGALLLIAVYAYLARYTPHRAVRRAAFLAISFSSGMGWLLTLLGRPDWLGMLPIDLILPEAYAFLMLYSPPHIPLATVCLLWGLECAQESIDRPGLPRRSRIGRILAAGLAFAIAALMAAFYILVPCVVLGIHWLVATARERKPDWGALGLIALSGALSALVVGYSLTFFALDPVYRAWASQNLVRSPHPLHYLLGYPIVGGLALAGAIRIVRTRRWRLRLPIEWVVSVPLLVYAPFSLQRRLIIAAQVPLCLLAAIGLVYAVALPFGRSRFVRWLSRHPRYSRAGMRRLLVTAVILSTVPTNLLLLLGNSIQVLQRKPPIFHSRAELEALDWLRMHSAPDETVLCAYETGNYVPAQAGNRVLLGLGPETIQFEQKRDEVRRFFSEAESDAWRQELLTRYRIAYVMVGPRERDLGGFDPGLVSYLRKVHTTDPESLDGDPPGEESYTLYQVVTGP